MTDHFDIPAFLDRRLSAEERNRVAVPKPEPRPERLPTTEELTTAARQEAHRQGLAKDAAVRAELTEHIRHREAIKEAIQAPAREAFFERRREERALEKEANRVREEAIRASRKRRVDFKKKRRIGT